MDVDKTSKLQTVLALLPEVLGRNYLKGISEANIPTNRSLWELLDADTGCTTCYMQGCP